MSLPVAAPLIAGGLTAGAHLSRGSAPRLRILIASAAGAVMLSALASFAPGIARAFATLIIAGAMLGPGYDVVRSLSRLIT